MPEAPRKLTHEEIKLALSRLPAWQIVDGRLRREYRFRDFVEAWGFMSSAALVIQQMDHHPEWRNVQHSVRVDLVTHEVAGISRRDIELATRFDELASRLAKLTV
jgi:4a-hydroxytetrahydrobiopterin dehydratase